MMMLQRQVSSALEHCNLVGSWIGRDVLRSMVELNADVLELLAEQAQEPTAQSNVMLRQYREQWRQLDAPARAHLAGTSFLLLDLGFTDPARWAAPVKEAVVRDRDPTCQTPFFTVPAAQAVACRAFYYAWDLSRTQENAARVLLAMTPRCAALVRELTVGQIHGLAEQHADWLVPRWHKRAKIWRDILTAAAAHDVNALERARSHGHDLIAAEARAAMGRSGP